MQGDIDKIDCIYVNNYYSDLDGRLAEWLKAHVWSTCLHSV